MKYKKKTIYLISKINFCFFFKQLAKSHSPNRINAMCTVIIKLTESIKALKEYELVSASN